MHAFACKGFHCGKIAPFVTKSVPDTVSLCMKAWYRTDEVYSRHHPVARHAWTPHLAVLDKVGAELAGASVPEEEGRRALVLAVELHIQHSCCLACSALQYHIPSTGELAMKQQ